MTGQLPVIIPMTTLKVLVFFKSHFYTWRKIEAHFHEKELPNMKQEYFNHVRGWLVVGVSDCRKFSEWLGRKCQQGNTESWGKHLKSRVMLFSGVL